MNTLLSKKAVLTLLLFLGILQVQSQENPKVLTAEESDPIKMGWMQGFPPPVDKQLKMEDNSFFTFPAMRWSVSNMRQFMPTVNVPKGTKAIQKLPYKLDASINGLTFLPLEENNTMTWEESLYKNYTDGILIMHKGTIVYERYFGSLTENGVHAAMSLTKSLTGTLGIMLVCEGVIDPEKKAVDYVPELKNSAFADATVRQIMDMTTALKYSEDYANPNAEVWAFSMAGNPLPKPKDYKGPRNYYEYLETVQKEGTHGKVFGYKTVNSDALGWIISRVTGKSVAQLLSERIWSKIGAEKDAYYSVDIAGIPFAGGGFNGNLRDMARFAEMIRHKGYANQQRILPECAVDDIFKGGDKKAFEASEYTKLKGWSYRNMWWITHNKHNAIMGRGVHGQSIYIDPTAEMVIVRFASHPTAANSANDPYTLPAYQAVAEYLLKQ